MTLGITKAYTPAAGETADSTAYNTDLAALFNAWAGLEADTPTSSLSNFAIDATGKLYLDGGSNSYLFESSADTIQTVVGGAVMLAVTAGTSTFNSDLGIPALKKFFLDSGVDTYIFESSADVVQVVVGDAVMMAVSSSLSSVNSNFAVVSGKRMYFDGGSSTDNSISDTTAGSASGVLLIGNETINTTSDIRLKKDIEDTKLDSLKVIDDLRVVDFDWNDKVEEGDARKRGGRFTGMIAQEMIKIAPWTVNHQGGKDCVLCSSGQECSEHPNYWFARYEYIVPVLVKAVQELNKKIKVLEA